MGQLFFLDDGKAQKLDPQRWVQSVLPGQLADLQAQATTDPDAAPAIAGLGHTALEHGSVAGGDLAAAALRALVSQGVGVAGPPLLRLETALLAARAEAEAPPTAADIGVSPLAGPVWGAVLKDAAPLLPRRRAEHAVVVFGFSVLGGAAREPRAGGESDTALLARGAALQLAEATALATHCTTTTATWFVPKRGLFTPTAAVDDLTLLALAPRTPPPRLLIAGRLQVLPGRPSQVTLHLLDVEEPTNSCVITGPALDGDVLAGVRGQATATAARLLGRPLRVPRATRADDDTAAASPDALLRADAVLQALLLAATGQVDPTRLANVPAALTSLLDLHQQSPTRDNALRVVAGAVCVSALGHTLDEHQQQLLASLLEQHQEALGPVAQTGARLLAALGNQTR